MVAWLISYWWIWIADERARARRSYTPGSIQPAEKRLSPKTNLIAFQKWWDNLFSFYLFFRCLMVLFYNWKMPKTMRTLESFGFWFDFPFFLRVRVFNVSWRHLVSLDWGLLSLRASLIHQTRATFVTRLAKNNLFGQVKNAPTEIYRSKLITTQSTQSGSGSQMLTFRDRCMQLCDNWLLLVCFNLT